MLLLILCLAAPVAKAQNPFQSGKAAKPQESATASGPSLLVRISLLQQKLKQDMAGLVRQAKTTGDLTPLLTLLVIGFAYGAIHAAGPGHGKAVAMTYILSRKASVRSGLLLGVLIALVHGMSGALCVLILHGILKTGMSGTLGNVSRVTQVVSFSLILILGIGILVRNGCALVSAVRSGQGRASEKAAGATGALIPWAVSVGLVPCPGVIMVLLFCLSMDVLGLGIALAACISLGMAATISLVVVAVSKGKGMALSLLPIHGATEYLDHILGAASGMAAAALGGLFLAAALS